MTHSRNLVTKIVFLGTLVAALIYLFHPGVGQLSLIINGEPVAEPLARLAAIPTLLLVIGVTALLSVLLFFGVGLLIFLGTLSLVFFGLVLVAPYFWPVLAVIFLVIALMSIGNESRN